MMLVHNLLLLSVLHSISSLSTTPVHQTALVNSSATFWCGSNHSVIWSFQRTGQLVHRRICVGGQLGDPRYTLNSSDDCDGLTIPDVQLSDSGLYTCIDNDGFGPAASARLVVLDSLPTCGSNVSASQPVFESETIELRCEVVYAGYPPPRVSWTSVGGATVNSSTTSSRMAGAMRIETWIVVPAAAGGVGRHRFTMTTFDDEDGVTGESTRAPIYVWNSPLFVVLYAVRDIIINVSADNHRYDEHLVVRGETLNCHADGFPPAEYEWTNVDTGRKSVGPDLQLDIEGHHTYQCNATNTVANVTYSVSARISVLVSGVTTSTTEEIAVRMSVGTAVVVATVTTAALALVAVCCGILFYRMFVVSRRRQRCNHHVLTEPLSAIVRPQVRATAEDRNMVKLDVVSASCLYDSIDEQLVGYEQLPLPASRPSTPHMYQSSPGTSPQSPGCDALDVGPFSTENDYLRICGGESDDEIGHAVRCPQQQQSNDGVRYMQPQELMTMTHDDRVYVNEPVATMPSGSAATHSGDDRIYTHTLSDD